MCGSAPCVPPQFSLLALSQLEAKGQAVLDNLELSQLSPTAPPPAGSSVVPRGGLDAWGRPSGKGNSPFSASGSDSDVDVVVDSADVRQSVTDAGSDTSTGGVAEGGRARGRGQFLEDDDDDDSGMDYRNKLAVVEKRQVNESDSEFVPSGGEVEVEGEADDNVSVQSFTSGGSSEFEAGSADHSSKTVVSRKQGRVIDDDVSCSSGTAGRCCACSCPICVSCPVQFWETDPSMYGLRRSSRIQRDFTNTVIPSVDYVSWQLTCGVG